MGAKQESNFYDVAIAGGGPAGTVAAILLARAGYSVALATVPPVEERQEGLSPRVTAILQSNGLALAGVAPPSQRRAAWGATQGAQNVEHIVSRAVFDLGLLGQARDEGVVIQEGGIATVQPEASTIRMSDGRVIRAALIFEARGRRAPRVVLPHADRGAWIGPETISIAGHVDAPSGALPGSDITARPEGWIWRTPGRDGRPWMQVVGDAGIFRNERGSQVRITRLWRHVLGPDADTIMLPDRPVVSACALRLNALRLDPACPRLGDAAVALDPLSGHGIFWAISSALMALPMVRAIFAGEIELAQAFYRDRVIDTFWRQARIARDFYASAGQGGAFWAARRVWPDGKPAHPPVTAPRLEERVLIRGGKLVRGEVLITDADPGGAAFVLGHEVAPIVRAVGDQPLPALSVFHKTYLPQLPASVAEGLHGWLISRGLGNGLPLHS